MLINRNVKQIAVGERILFAEHDGMIERTIKAFLWSPLNKGEVYYPKDAILVPALEWSIVLFEDGYFCYGKDIMPKY